LDRLADLIPPPRKHRHRNTKVFAPNHPLRQGRDDARHRQCRGSQTPNQGCCHAVNARAAHGNGHCNTAGPRCGGDIRLIAFIIESGPIRKILTHDREPLEPPPVPSAHGPPTDWAELG